MSPSMPIRLPASPTVDTVMAQERAASFGKRSIKSTTKKLLLDVALSMLDLTTLEGKDSPEKVRGLCRKAMRPFERDEQVLGRRLPNCAAVCVYPSMVGTCAEELGGSDVAIASVATGFPSGQYPLEIRLRDVRDAVASGADEIDMVISRGAFLAGRYDEVVREIIETKHACVRPDGSYAHLKVILETGELETLDNVRRASDLAIAALDTPPVRGGSAMDAEPLAAGDAHNGHAKPVKKREGVGSKSRPTTHDFIKTSTGKVQPAATMPVTLVMLEAIRDHYLRSGELIGMKPAGGIRSAKQAIQYLIMVHEVMGPLGAGDAFAALHADEPQVLAQLDTVSGNPWLTPVLFRFGASTLCNDILRQIVKQHTGTYVAGYDFAEA